MFCRPGVPTHMHNNHVPQPSLALAVVCVARIQEFRLARIEELWVLHLVALLAPNPSPHCGHASPICDSGAYVTPDTYCDPYWLLCRRARVYPSLVEGEEPQVVMLFHGKLERQSTLFALGLKNLEVRRAAVGWYHV